MYKACSRCGRIHHSEYKCELNKTKFDYSRYSGREERRLRDTAAWARKSQEIREAAQYLCEVCRDRGVYNFNNLEVHHIIKLRADQSRLLDNSNLICLCSMHHRQADSGKLDATYLQELAAKREKNR